MEFEADATEDQAAVEIGNVETQQLGSEGLGDTAGGVQLTADITTSGVTFPFSFASQSVRVDRALVGMFTTTIGWPSGRTVDRAALLQVMVDAVSDQSS